MARIPEEIIDRIRSTTDIVDIVSEHVQLKQRGRNYFGLCPFHTENSPSFSVNPELQIFRCFGCGAGGNVFTFLQDIDHVSFVEAVSFLGERTGIPLPTNGDGHENEVADLLYQVNELARKYFHHMLRQESGAPALRYLHGRGVTDETIDRFGLGYAPGGWTDFLELAGKRQFKPDLLEQAGLVVPSRKGKGFYDRFRNRVIFPIANLSDRTIGFGARALDPEDEPKYLNSPETPIYHKSSILYGLSASRDEIRKRDCAIVVEGYMDVLSLFQRGIQNVIASSGTALTDDHCRTLTRYTHSVTLLFDGDAAGSAASMRGIEVLIAAGIDARVVSLPGGHDPDSFAQAEGAPALEAMLVAGQPAFDYILGALAGQFDTHSLSGRDQAVRALLPLFARCTDAVRVDHLFQETAGRFGIDETALRHTIKGLLAKGGQRRSQAAPSSEEPLPNPPRREREFVGLLLLHPEFIAPSAQQLEPEVLTDGRCRRVVRHLFENYTEARLDLSLLMSETTDERLTQLISLCAMEGFDETHIQEQWQDYMVRFQREALTRRIEDSRRELREAVHTSQGEDVERINTEMSRLIQDRQRLQTTQ